MHPIYYPSTTCNFYNLLECTGNLKTIECTEYFYDFVCTGNTYDY